MAKLPVYHTRNMKNIAQLGDKTKAVVLAVYAEAIKAEINILFYSTIRTLEVQKGYYASGASQTMRSYHLVGQAFDVVLCDGAEDNWKAYGTADFKKFIAIAKKHGLTWGGDWDNDGSSRDETFIDSPHFQYGVIGYGNDTFVSKGIADLPVVVQATKPVVKPKPTPIVKPKPVVKLVAKPVVKPVVKVPAGSYAVVAGDTLGEIGVKYKLSVAELKTLNGLKSDVLQIGQVLKVVKPAPKPVVRTGEITGDIWSQLNPFYLNTGRVKVLKKGDRYKVYAVKNGYYSVGGSEWVNSKFMKLV